MESMGECMESMGECMESMAECMESMAECMESMGECMESMAECMESMAEYMESMAEYMEQKHSTWNPPGMWGQGKVLCPVITFCSLPPFGTCFITIVILPCHAHYTPHFICTYCISCTYIAHCALILQLKLLNHPSSYSCLASKIL